MHLRSILTAGAMAVTLAACSSQATPPTTTTLVSADQQAFNNLLRQAQHDAFGGGVTEFSSSSSDPFRSLSAAKAAAEAAAQKGAVAARSQLDQLNAFGTCLTDVQACQVSKFSGKLKQDLVKLQAAEAKLHRDETGQT